MTWHLLGYEKRCLFEAASPWSVGDYSFEKITKLANKTNLRKILSIDRNVSRPPNLINVEQLSGTQAHADIITDLVSARLQPEGVLIKWEGKNITRSDLSLASEISHPHVRLNWLTAGYDILTSDHLSGLWDPLEECSLLSDLPISSISDFGLIKSEFLAERQIRKFNNESFSDWATLVRGYILSEEG